MTSCVKDDFCVDPITPNLIVRFYDATNNSLTKTVSNLTVTPLGGTAIYSGVSLDSIVLPLNVASTQTVYTIATGTSQDQITINYNVNEIFVSRSCGFKATFSNVLFTTNNVWITSILPTTAITIENETAAHIQVFH